MNSVPHNPAAATLHLMSHYALCPCPLLAHAIATQLTRLSQSCSDSSAMALKLADMLMPQWRHIAGGSAVVRH